MARSTFKNLGHLWNWNFPFFFAIALISLTLSGCSDRLSSHGHIINENEISKIQIGVTTKTEILELLGRPSFNGAFEKQKLYYSSQVMLQAVASVKETQHRIIYVFSFNTNDVLESIQLISKEDGLQIAHIDDKTPTPGDTYGVLEQIFSNLRRRQSSE